MEGGRKSGKEEERRRQQQPDPPKQNTRLKPTVLYPVFHFIRYSFSTNPLPYPNSLQSKNERGAQDRLLKKED